MLTERTFLQGNKKERIYQALTKAGWFYGRKVDISSVLDYYAYRNINLTTKAMLFFQEFYGIASKWYIEVGNLENVADFEFQLFPYPRDYRIDIRDFMYDDSNFLIESEEYKNVMDYSKEHIVMVGEIGYYYPARVWIGDSGILYCTHEYEYDVLKFDSIVQLIHNELLSHDLESVAMKP